MSYTGWSHSHAAASVRRGSVSSAAPYMAAACGWYRSYDSRSYDTPPLPAADCKPPPGALDVLELYRMGPAAMGLKGKGEAVRRTRSSS